MNTTIKIIEEQIKGYQKKRKEMNEQVIMVDGAIQALVILKKSLESSNIEESKNKNELQDS